jgi:bisphosphoglycerate-independent phosphoglycerate mutase (AlkP superfamily)
MEGEKHLTKAKRIFLLPSRKDVPTHDLAPEMRAMDIADKAKEVLAEGTDFLFVNIANP